MGMKRTYAEQIEVKPNGVIQARFAKLRLNEDGTPDGEPQWHRTLFEPDMDIDAHMEAVNAHLRQMGENPVEAECVKRIKAHAKIARTPENLAACAALRAKQREAAEALAKEARAAADKALAAREEAAAQAEVKRKAEFEAAVAKAVAELMKTK